MNVTKTIILAVFCLALGALFGYYFSKDDGAKAKLVWSYGDANLELDLQQDLASDTTLLTKIFSYDYSKAGASNWLEREQEMFHFSDPDLVDNLYTVDYDASVSQRLRKLRSERKGPWSYQVEEVQVGIPERNDQPFIGYANVCASGIFRGQTIELFRLDRPERKITVRATGTYSCPDGYDFPDVQLSYEDAKKLFEYSNFNRTEAAGAVVVAE